MFGKRKTCETCEAYKKQVAYLEKILDRLLILVGSTPIKDKTLIPSPEEPSKVEKEFAEMIERGGDRLGLD